MTKYKKIFVLFDNDEAGIRSMKRYKEKYDFDYVVLDMEKDLSDSITLVPDLANGASICIFQGYMSSFILLFKLFISAFLIGVIKPL